MALLLAVLLLAGLALVFLWRRPAPNAAGPVARSWRLWLCYAYAYANTRFHTPLPAW